MDVLLRVDANFLQGLYFDSDTKIFYESAGLYGQSKVQELERVTVNEDYEKLVAKSGQTTNLDKKYFGEGMAPRSASEFVVLTWKENEMFILNRDTMEVNRKHKLPSGPKEGWGITSVEKEDQEHYTMYLSDGSSTIFELNGKSLQIVRQFKVTDEESGQEYKQLNELEYAKGFIYANVWFSHDILKIDPQTGYVKQKWSLPNFKEAEQDYQLDMRGSDRANVLNGIAYDRLEDVFYFSGKRWHLVFKVKLFK